MKQSQGRSTRSLARALGIGDRGVHAFVGAGGKTSTIRRLLRERVRAIATTTTHLERSGFGHGLLAVAPDVETLVDMQKHLLAARPLTLALTGDTRRVRAPPMSWHLQFNNQSRNDVILVEADGAARRLVKRPGLHEPAWPPVSLASAIIVVGLSALGEPVRSVVHRPERFKRARLGAENVGLEHLAVMLRDYVQAAPPQTPLTLLCTGFQPQHQAALADLTRHFERLVRSRNPVLQNPNVALRIVAAEQITSGAIQYWQRGGPADQGVPALPGVCGVLLAAGLGRRYRSQGRETSKLLARWRRRPLIAHAVSNWCAAGFGELLVVLGHAARELEPLVHSAAAKSATPIRIVYNRQHARGLGTSIRTAARHSNPDLGLLFGHADMPAIRSATLGRLATLGTNLRTWIVVPTVEGERRNPAYFPADLRRALLRVPDSAGGKAVSEQQRDRVLEVEMAAPHEFVDVDHPNDLACLNRKGSGAPRMKRRKG